MIYSFLKRALDIVACTLGLLILSPAIITIAIIIKLTAPGPILYRASRVGMHNKPFTMFKFRSMVINADKIGGPSTAGDDSRLTNIGKILRRFKLDELPELANVLIGNMSVVGPRPEVQMYVNMMTPQEREVILSVRPGITDWASLSNMHEEETLHGAADPELAYQEKIWPEKKRLQIKYVRERSLKNDIAILFQTLKKLIS